MCSASQSIGVRRWVRERGLDVVPRAHHQRVAHDQPAGVGLPGGLQDQAAGQIAAGRRAPTRRTGRAGSGRRRGPGSRRTRSASPVAARTATPPSPPTRSGRCSRSRTGTRSRRSAGTGSARAARRVRHRSGDRERRFGHGLGRACLVGGLGVLQNHVAHHRLRRYPASTRGDPGVAGSATCVTGRVLGQRADRDTVGHDGAQRGDPGRDAHGTGRGSGRRRSAPSATAMARSWTRRCTRWMMRCGQPPPRLNALARCLVSPSAVRSGSARIRAAATASATARLIPTPPIGDIACAASPMNSKPSVYQRRSRLSCTSRSLTSSNDVSVVDPVGQPRHQLGDLTAQRLDALGPHRVSAPFRIR